MTDLHRTVTKRLLSVPLVRHAVNVSTPTAALTVERLTEAAAEAFAVKGFSATTTRDIATRAGLSPAGVYVYFGSKEELLFELSRSGHQAALALVRAARDEASSPPEQLAAIMRRFSEWHVEQVQMARVVYHEHSHLTPAHQAEMLSLRKDIDGIVRSVLNEGVANGEFVIDDVGDTALALLSIVIDVARWYSPTIRRTPTQIGATNAALGLRLVGARR
ncbi:MAG TPA: TetR/AcrR family transcriptional regulator [Dermatophilaceae bacterium]|nr:TetR/AcrR family transcriptional regulator [Dermatophilaceae bacterium]